MDCLPNLERCRGHNGTCIGVKKGWSFPFQGGDSNKFFKKHAVVVFVQQHLSRFPAATVLQCIQARR